jgi:hypothetical protein
MTRRRALCGAVLLTVMIGAVPLRAHHSFAMFDTGKRVTLVGTVTAFEWTNPHAYIELDVPDEKGAVKHWSVELGVPASSAGRMEVQRHQGGRQSYRSDQSAPQWRAGGLLSQVTLRDGRVLGNGPGRGAQ